MSNMNPTITNEAVIPQVETKLFEGHETARFAVGILAVGDAVKAGLDEEYLGYLRLRANVYADQTGFISKELVQEDGTERDKDDARSVHFGIIENKGNFGRIVAALRVIVKSEEDDRPLPVEDFYPEAFTTPAPINSNEASRYICRHENALIQDSLTHPLFSAAVTFVVSHGLRPTYGVVEAPVETILKTKNVPIERIADPKYIPEYATENLGVQVDTDLLARVMELRNPGIVQKMRHDSDKFIYFGAAEQPQTDGAVA